MLFCLLVLIAGVLFVGLRTVALDSTLEQTQTDLEQYQTRLNRATDEISDLRRRLSSRAA